MRNEGEVNQGNIDALQKQIELLLALQKQLSGVDSKEPDIMIFTEAMGAQAGVELALHFPLIIDWLAATPEDKLKTLNQAQQALKEILANPAFVRFAAKKNAKELVNAALAPMSSEQFKALVVEELGRWELDPVKGVIKPHGDSEHTPSVTAIACLLSQAPPSIDRDPEGLIVYAIEQFRLRYLAKDSVYKSEQGQQAAKKIIELLLTLPTHRDQTTLNDLRVYKRYPGQPLGISRDSTHPYEEIYVAAAGHEMDPLPLEFEQRILEGSPPAEGVLLTDVAVPQELRSSYSKPIARRRPHNQYTLLMIASIYEMEGIVQLLVHDPRIDLHKETTILAGDKKNRFPNWDIHGQWAYGMPDEYRSAKDKRLVGHYALDSHVIGVPSDALTITRALKYHYQEIEEKGETITQFNFYKSREGHLEAVTILSRALFDEFIAMASARDPETLDELLKPYHGLFNPETIARTYLATAIAEAANTNDPLEKYTVLCSRMNLLNKETALTAYLRSDGTFFDQMTGGNQLDKLKKELFKEIQKNTPSVPVKPTGATLLTSAARNINTNEQDQALAAPNLTGKKPK